MKNVVVLYLKNGDRWVVNKEDVLSINQVEKPKHLQVTLHIDPIVISVEKIEYETQE